MHEIILDIKTYSFWIRSLLTLAKEKDKEVSYDKSYMNMSETGASTGLWS